MSRDTAPPMGEGPMQSKELGFGRLFWAAREADVEARSIVLWNPAAERLSQAAVQAPTPEARMKR